MFLHIAIMTDEVLMQMRITLRLPKIYSVCLLIGQNTLCSEFLSFRPATPLILKTLLWDYTVKRKLKIKEIRDKSYEFQHSLQSVVTLCSCHLSAHLPSYLLVDCTCYFPVNTAWKVKGRSSVNLMWDTWKQTIYYALLDCVGSKGLTPKLCVRI